MQKPNRKLLKKIGKRRQVPFPDLWQAFFAGYAPCRHCFGGLAPVLTPAP